MLTNNYIKQTALDIGFDLVGITYPQDFQANSAAIEQWIASGGADTIEYIKRYGDVRRNPANLMEGTKSIVVCAINYKNQYSLATPTPHNAKIASYALSRDYHKVVGRQLKRLLRSLQATDCNIVGRCCVDTAPLLEKQLAHEAGLGWIGRQSLLITPQYGSYVVLGVLLLDTQVDFYDSPYSGAECGQCHRCVEQCPTNAILSNKMIDTRRCISALTQEGESTERQMLHGWIFGCDECQQCCPHNQRTPLATLSEIQPIIAPIASQGWRSLSEEEFSTLANATPLKRAGLARLQRNCENNGE